MKVQNLEHPFILQAIVTSFGDFFQFLFFFLAFFFKKLDNPFQSFQEWHKFEVPFLCVSIAKSLTCLLSIAETCDMSPYALRAIWDNYLATTIISVFAALAQQLFLARLGWHQTKTL
jgi:hypothetical protein